MNLDQAYLEKNILRACFWINNHITDVICISKKFCYWFCWTGGAYSDPFAPHPYPSRFSNLPLALKYSKAWEGSLRTLKDRIWTVKKGSQKFCAISVNAFLRSHQLSGSEPRAKRSQSLGRRVRRHKEKYTSSKRGTQWVKILMNFHNMEITQNWKIDKTGEFMKKYFQVLLSSFMNILLKNWSTDT